MNSNNNNQITGQSNNYNLVKLRMLLEKLDKKGDSEYHRMAKNIKMVVESGQEKIKSAHSAELKLKCCESVLASVSAILTGINEYV